MKDAIISLHTHVLLILSILVQEAVVKIAYIAFVHCHILIKWNRIQVVVLL